MTHLRSPPTRSRNLWLEPSGKPTKGLLQGLWGGKSNPVGLPQGHLWTERVIWPHLCSGRWPRREASWMSRYMRCRRFGLAGRDQSCQSCCKSLPEGHTVILHGNANQIAQHYGAKGSSLSRNPTLARHLLLLPLVQKEGQNEGMVINHLRTMHDHLGLVCACAWTFLLPVETPWGGTHASVSPWLPRTRTVKRKKNKK